MDKSQGLENIDPENAIRRSRAVKALPSPQDMTFGNNGNFSQSAALEKAFRKVSGAGNGTVVEHSLARNLLILHNLSCRDLMRRASNRSALVGVFRCRASVQNTGSPAVTRLADSAGA